MYDASVSPANETYPTALGQITRNVVLFDQNKTPTINGATATLVWSYLVNLRYTNLTNNNTKVIQRPKTYTKTIPY